MRKTRIAAATFIAVTAVAAVAEARGNTPDAAARGIVARSVTRDGEDLYTRKTAVIDLRNVNDTSDEDYPGRTGDIDICNPGAARGIDGNGNYSADINDDDCYE